MRWTLAATLGLLLVMATPRAHADDAGALDAAIDDAGVVDAGLDASLDAGEEDAALPPLRDAGIELLPPPPEGHDPLIASERSPEGDVHVGELVTWTIRATVPEGDDVQMPRQTFRALEIRRRRVYAEPARDGKQTFVIRIELIAFEAGEHAVGPLRLRVVTDDGRLGSVDVPGIRVRVRSLIGNEPNAEPKPARPPVTLVEEDPTPKYVGAALLAMLVGGLLALLARRWWQRRPKVLPPPPPPRPAFDVAIERLDALAAERAARMEAGESEIWVDALSDTIRVYLGARYGFDGLELTTNEIEGILRTLHLGTISWQEIGGFLGECDLTKFAAVVPSDEQAEALLATARRIVLATRAHFTLPDPGAPTAGGAS